MTGFVASARGVSLDANPNGVRRFGRDPTRWMSTRRLTRTRKFHGALGRRFGAMTVDASELLNWDT